MTTILPLLLLGGVWTETHPALLPIEDDPDLPRVLLIGDSISVGYTLPVRELLRGMANVHWPLENCGPTIKGLQRLDEWLGEGEWDVIHFNWGLHDLRMDEDGVHQVPIDAYEENLEALITRLQQTGAELIWCSTTPVPEPVDGPFRTNADVIAYNKVAAAIMLEHGIQIDDLYEFALPQLEEIQLPHNVHFSPEGSAVLARQVAASIETALTPPD